MNILLIDKRVSRYEDLVDAIDPNLAIGITFDYHADTFETIKARIIEALQLHSASSTAAQDSVSVGLIQHNYNAPTFSMVASEHTASSASSSSSSASCIVSQVETLDPNLETWTRFKDFIVWCKTECGAAHFDMMACALYSNPDWKYIIDTLAKPAPGQTGVDIRASTDDTGSAALGGDWFLESHSGVNLKDVYFTEKIDTYRGVFGAISQQSFFITTAGSVYGTGANYNGQLGLDDVTHRNVPTLIASLPQVVAVSTGNAHSLFLTSTGRVYSTGWNHFGQLGLGIITSEIYVPTLISTLTNVVAISSCEVASLFLTSSGAVYGTGNNYNGELGVGDNLNNKNVPTLILSLTNVVAVSSGGTHSLFLTSTGAVYSAGWNAYGQLGLDNNVDKNVPTLIETLTNVVAISAGSRYSFFLTRTGAVYATGRNDYGQLGLGDTTDRNVPTLITTLTNVIAISAGANHSLFLTSTGAVYATGRNDYGQLGLNDNSHRLIPTLISALANVNVVAVSTGTIHSLFLTSTGAVYSTGYNGEGRLGLGDTADRNVPTLVSGTYVCVPDMVAPANFVSVGEGTNSIAYSYDGVNWNTSIQNTSVFSDQGYGVSYNSALSRWVAVGAGTNHTIAYSLNGITWVGVGKTIFSTRGNGVA